MAENNLIQGQDIAKVLRDKGPLVRCVLLRHMRTDGKDTKPHPTQTKDTPHQRQVLTELIDEIELDTTPQKAMVKEILGGTFTFLGQFETEGIVVMARKELPEDLESLSIKELREMCDDRKIDTTDILEKQELIDALLDSELPVNPHKLQPPLDGLVVRGDILLLKVAETNEALDEGGEPIEMNILSNDEFFLNYTKSEYVKFASRTDIVASEQEDDEEGDDEEESDNEEEEDEDYDMGDEGEDDEEERRAMLNLVMSEVLRKFREENGRGPDTRELLEIRSKVAEQLDVEVATFDEIAGEEEEEEATSEKRPLADEIGPEEHSPKKVKFTNGTSYGKEEDDKKG